ncbi:MAG TPA: DinB family protein [Rhodothermales bacterium]|nr:DinB family protein [Rhodothermales bacterium]
MTAALADSLARSVRGDAWHGPSFLEALARLDAAGAAARPIPGAHSAWEIALHVAGWMHEVASRLQGGKPALPEPGDWPPVPMSQNEASWQQVRAQVEAALDAVLAALTVFPPERLDAPVGEAAHHDAPLGTGLSYAEMLRGLAQHNAYHAGQLVLLHRALQAHEL